MNDNKTQSSPLGPPSKLAVDTGATGNYIGLNMKCSNKQIAEHPIQVLLPNKQFVTSTHTAELPLPKLPLAARTAHIFPDFGETALLSVGQCCDAGCDVQFSHDKVIISYNNETIITGSREHHGLWYIDIEEEKIALVKILRPEDINICCPISNFSNIA